MKRRAALKIKIKQEKGEGRNQETRIVALQALANRATRG
jgi:hypothetical protein